MNDRFWAGKRVLVTGHTGFKGGWLALWLQKAGARVFGFSTLPPTEPNLFTVAKVQEGLEGHLIADIRDAEALSAAVRHSLAEIVFHLAAQPLVRYSYANPLETFSVNVMGTAQLLEVIRTSPSVRAVVNVTTDKCYENKEWVWGYRENEPLGGRDPYSGSKACSELVTTVYRESFLAQQGVHVATARAGNVIGGGDWAVDRLVPDFFRAYVAGRILEVRHPEAIRPWQHVLEPLSGYLLLAERLFTDGHSRTGAWNFGPEPAQARSVRWILERLQAELAAVTWKEASGVKVHEAHYLKLDSSKAQAELGWQPRWDLEQALARTAQWYLSWRSGGDLRELCLQQIAAYESCGARQPP
jgi:CDP-glucose 4,6-dehydratase